MTDGHKGLFQYNYVKTVDARDMARGKFEDFLFRDESKLVCVLIVCCATFPYCDGYMSNDTCLQVVAERWIISAETLTNHVSPAAKGDLHGIGCCSHR